MLDRTRNAFIHHTMHAPRTMFAAAIDPESLFALSNAAALAP